MRLLEQSSVGPAARMRFPVAMTERRRNPDCRDWNRTKAPVRFVTELGTFGRGRELNDHTDQHPNPGAFCA
jgi:hypothetical protein